MDLPLVVRNVGALLLSPSSCAACDTPVPQLTAFCAPCAGTVEPSDDPLTVGQFGGALATAIHKLKFGDRPDLARPLGALLASRCLAAAFSPRTVDVVVPVPLGLLRLSQRGYNQSQLLAARVGAALGVPVLPLALARLRETEAQASLHREARALNLRGAIACRTRRLSGRRVLLVDDVRTTGATLDAAATAVAMGGGLVVGAATVAVAPLG